MLTRHRAPRPAPPPKFYLPLNTAFYVCLVSHILAALYAPIQDCDETFNYWEPTHYLAHGYGLQTWEYSPDYGIRSWLYILLHTAPLKFMSLLGKQKSFEFYFLRVLFAFVCAGCETRLFSVFSRVLNPRVGLLYLIITAFTPGMFYASVAYLPSSFTMLCSMLGMASFMDWSTGPKTQSGIMWFGIGAVVGWPFSGVLAAPFLVEELIVAVISREGFETGRRILDGTIRTLIVVVRFEESLYMGHS